MNYIQMSQGSVGTQEFFSFLESEAAPAFVSAADATEARMAEWAAIKAEEASYDYFRDEKDMVFQPETGKYRHIAWTDAYVESIKSCKCGWCDGIPA